MNMEFQAIALNEVLWKALELAQIERKLQVPPQTIRLQVPGKAAVHLESLILTIQDIIHNPGLAENLFQRLIDRTSRTEKSRLASFGPRPFPGI